MKTFKIIYKIGKKTKVRKVQILNEFEFYGLKWVIHKTLTGQYTVSEYSTGLSVGYNRLEALNNGDPVESTFDARELAVKLLKKVEENKIFLILKEYPVINVERKK
jgi:hypothetical protein